MTDERVEALADTDLELFCRAEWPRLVGALSFYTADGALSEDLAQETLIRVCEHWDKVRALAIPQAWAHRVAINLARSHFRRRRTAFRVATAVGELSEHERDSVDPADRLALRAAVASLPRRQREALVLRYYVDLPVSAIADTLGCPEGTVKTHIHRALESLRTSRLIDVADDME